MCIINTVFAPILKTLDPVFMRASRKAIGIGYYLWDVYFISFHQTIRNLDPSLAVVINMVSIYYLDAQCLLFIWYDDAWIVIFPLSSRYYILLCRQRLEIVYLIDAKVGKKRHHSLVVYLFRLQFIRSLDIALLLKLIPGSNEHLSRPCWMYSHNYVHAIAIRAHSQSVCSHIPMLSRYRFFANSCIFLLLLLLTPSSLVSLTPCRWCLCTNLVFI